MCLPAPLAVSGPFSVVVSLVSKLTPSLPGKNCCYRGNSETQRGIGTLLPTLSGLSAKVEVRGKWDRTPATPPHWILDRALRHPWLRTVAFLPVLVQWTHCQQVKATFTVPRSRDFVWTCESSEFSKESEPQAAEDLDPGGASSVQRERSLSPETPVDPRRCCNDHARSTPTRSPAPPRCI